MNQLSEKSIEKLSKSHATMRELFLEVAKEAPFEVVKTHIDKKEYLLTHNGKRITSPFLLEECPVVVAVAYDDKECLDWSLKTARIFRNRVYQTAKRMGISVVCGRNNPFYNDIPDYKNHYFELVL